VAKARPSLRPPQAAPEHVRGLWLLADLAADLTLQDNVQALQETILDHAAEMFACASGAVCLWDVGGQRVRIGPAMGKARHLSPQDLVGAKDVRRAVLEEKRPVAWADPGEVLGTPLGGWHGLAVIPLVGSEHVLGAVILGDREGKPAFSDADTALMVAVGNVAASALETHETLGSLQQRMQDMGRRMTETMAELGRAAVELQRIKTFHEELFNSAPVGVLVFDREFRPTFRNRAAERLWPDDRSVLAGARRTALAARDPDWEAALRDVVHMRRPWRAEDVVYEAAGQAAVRLNLAASPLLSSRQEVVGGVLILEDTTPRRHMEARLAVSERLAGVGRLAAIVAHEINNPLDGILRLVNLARRAGAETGDPRFETYLSQAHKGLMRIAAIVRDLLDFSRTAGGAAGPMLIRDLLAEAAQSLAPAAEKARVTVALDGADDVPPLRSGVLFQVVLNLLKNAIEATPEGGRVEVRARVQDDALVIEVADTGPGLPDEMLARLFEPFHTLKAGGKGTGLGLVISKDLVEKQGGTLTAVNRPEGGAVFTVRVPLGQG